MKTTALAFLGAFALTVAGTTASQAQQPKRGGTLQFAISAEPPNNDGWTVAHRIVPSHKVVMGWKLSPSHLLCAQLEDVWLKQ